MTFIITVTKPYFCCKRGITSAGNRLMKDTQTISALRHFIAADYIVFCLFFLTSTSKITIVFEHKF